MQYSINAKPWSKPSIPRKVLVIRYQATGDLVVALPYLNSLKRKHPSIQLHLLTREEVNSIPRTLPIFNKVISVGGGRNTFAQLLMSLLKVPFLWVQRYDLIIDLQNHFISRLVRKILFPVAWSEFDRYSPRSAGERNRLTIEAANVTAVEADTNFKQIISENQLREKLQLAGWKGVEFITLNPAGAFETRHWPIQNYVEFARQWRTTQDVQFLVTGLRNKMGDRVKYLKRHLGESLIDLTDTTSAAEAFALVRKSKLVLTEDGGLMHMAWVQGVPTIALFGSSRSDWAAPQGRWSLCLNSSDLPCGNCLLEKCKFDDVHCLTRFTPSFVKDQAHLLLKKLEKPEMYSM